MIEPQNTMMPLPAESAPADVPHGEAGFGEMLAQTLGLVPQVDANTILEIMGNDQGSGQDGVADEDAPLDLSNHREAISPDHVSVGQYLSMPVAGPILASEVKDAPPPTGDTPITDPVFDKDVPTPPPVEPRVNPETPHPVIAQPAKQQPVVLRPTPVAPGDGIWEPVLSDHITEAETAVPEIAAKPFAPEGLPVDADAAAGISGAVATAPIDTGLIGVEPTPIETPPSTEPAPVSPGVDPTADPGPIVAEVVRNIAPDQLVRESIDPIPDRRLPADPKPMADAPQPVTTPAARMATPAPAPSSPLLDLGRETPVRITDSEVPVSGRPTVPVGDTHVAVGDHNATAPLGLPVADAGRPQPTPMVDGAAPPLPVQNTALAQRVMQAVELQANQPPPRTMVVDIPEIEGLRLVVSVRSGAEVHVVPSTSSATSHGLQPFMDELQGVLASRGFVMTGDGRRRGNNPFNDERPEPHRAQRPTFRRPQPTDNDLRI